MYNGQQLGITIFVASINCSPSPHVYTAPPWKQSLTHLCCNVNVFNFFNKMVKLKFITVVQIVNYLELVHEQINLTFLGVFKNRHIFHWNKRLHRLTPIGWGQARSNRPSSTKILRDSEIDIILRLNKTSKN